MINDDIKEKLKKISINGWVMLALATFFYTFQNLIRVSPSVMKDNIIQAFNISYSDFGSFSGFYYLGYSLMHIPFGIAYDRFRLRYVMAFALALTVIGIIPLVLDWPWSMVVAGRFLVGAGSSGAILSMFKVFRTYFPLPWFSTLLGLSATIGILGAVYGGAPIDIMQQKIGYVSILNGIIIIGLISAFLVILIKTPPGDKNAKSILDQLGSVLRNKKVILISVFSGLMIGPLEGFADVWAVPYLEHVADFTREQATFLPSLVFIGFAAGCPLIAIISERLNSYYGVAVACGLLSALCFFVLFASTPSFTITSVLFLLIGACCAYQVMSIAINLQNIDESQAGLITAITNMVMMVFGMFFHNFIGIVADFFWDGRISETGLHLYANKAYIYSISIVPIMLLIGAIGLKFTQVKFDHVHQNR